MSASRKTICRTLCVSLGHLSEQNITAQKPMSELPSAMFLIADGSEFGSWFYIVCEEVPLGTPESLPIVSGVSDMHPADCQNVKRHESDANIQLEEMLTFFSNEYSLCIST